MITIDFLYSILGTPLGYIMWVCYLLVNNFGFAIIIFTLIVKAAMFPLNLKQQKNQAKAQLFAPRVKEIQTKYRNNQPKMQEEMAKLQKEGYNPMGGCGTMLLTMVLLFGVIDVVYKPMTHMEHLNWGNDGAIDTVVNQAKKSEFIAIISSNPQDKQAVLEFFKDSATLTLINDDAATADVNESNQIVIAENADDNKENDIVIDTLKDEYTITDQDLKDFDKIVENIAVIAGNTSKLSNEVKNALNTANGGYNSSLYRELRAIRVYQNHPDAFKNIGLSQEVLDKLDNLNNGMTFCGINLGLQPSFSWNILLIIPILSFLMSIAQTILSQYVQKKSNPSMAQVGGGMKILLYIMPLFSLYISFIVPAGVGFYWAVSYFFGIIQTLVTYKVWPPEKLQAEEAEKLKQKNINISATIVDVTTDEKGNEVKVVKKMTEMSQKEIREYQRKKIEDARRADAEKYGDEDIPELPPLDDEKTIADEALPEDYEPGETDNIEIVADAEVKDADDGETKE